MGRGFFIGGQADGVPGTLPGRGHFQGDGVPGDGVPTDRRTRSPRFQADGVPGDAGGQIGSGQGADAGDGVPTDRRTRSPRFQGADGAENALEKAACGRVVLGGIFAAHTIGKGAKA